MYAWGKAPGSPVADGIHGPRLCQGRIINSGARTLSFVMKVAFETMASDDLQIVEGRTRSFTGFVADVLEVLAKTPERLKNGAKNPLVITRKAWNALHPNPAKDGGPNSAQRIGPAISLVHDNLRRKGYWFRVNRAQRKSDGEVVYVITTREGADLADDKAKYSARVEKRKAEAEA